MAGHTTGSEGDAARLRQQSAALAQFGHQALQGRDLDAMLHEACLQVSNAIGTDLVKVLELLSDGDTMLIRQGVNWKPGVVGHATLPAHGGSPSGYALEHDEPVISRDVAKEDRFEIPRVMIDHDVQSMVNVVIKGEGAPWGVLEVDSRRTRDWNDDDIAFLQNYANLLAGAIDRLNREGELRQAVEAAEMLLAELQHRVRNLLMNIHALARRTARDERNLQEFMTTFEARLAALGRTQDLLTRGSDGASLKEALRQELFAHGAEESKKVDISGPPLRLPPKITRALGMAFHELATNSVKYGALKTPGARIDIQWEPGPSGEDTELRIRWRETGVALAGEPERRGFGTETIERSLPHMLGGESLLKFHADGIEWSARFIVPHTVVS